MRKNVRELKPYSLKELVGMFKDGHPDPSGLIQELMKRGIVRCQSKNAQDGVDLSAEEQEARPDECYHFNFVGIVMSHDLVIVAYPKYFQSGEKAPDDIREPTDGELQQVLRVIKHNAGRMDDTALSDDGEQANEKLPVMLALLDLYAEFGLYSNYVEGRELNGFGPIDWNRTISNHLPILVDGRPIYAEYETRKAYRNESDFITRLHRAVLTECSKKLFDAGIDKLLSLEDVELTNEEVDELGDTETLEWHLEREHSTQFIDWKIATLDLLKRYLLDRENAVERDEIHTLGTTSFFHLWEEACKVAFGDKLNKRLDDLGLELAAGWDARKGETLQNIIPRPKWERRTQENAYVPCSVDKTLVPDTVTFAVDDEGKDVFCIYDAKYYVPSIGKKIENQPELKSVTKQFLYQSAYKNFVTDHGFDRVVNAFLAPTADGGLRELARVSFSEVMGKVEPPFSNYIHMWALPASEVFDAYLQGRRIDAGTMSAIWKNEE